MKKSILGLLLAAVTIANAQNTIDLNPAVKNVTVYQTGAVVTHEVQTSIPSGKSTVIFHGLPCNIDKQSIQLVSTGDITILSVTSYEDYVSESKKNVKTKRWQDSLEVLSDALERVKDGITILDAGKSLLDNNRTVGGANVGTSVANVKGMYEYYVHQVTHIEDSLILLRKKQRGLESKIAKIQNEMMQWKNKADTLASDIEALVSADHAQDLGFRLSYLTYDAGWSAMYDLRAKDIKHACQLAYKANVYQHTGQDWANVDLTLSTSNPSVSQTAPIMNPWYLQFQSAYGYGTASSYNAAPAPSVAGVYQEDMKSEALVNNNVYKQSIVSNTVSESQLAVEFHIDVPYTLPSDNKPHMVEIKKYDLNAIYRFQSIPKLNQSAFLMADITHWDELNLMSGEVNIYFAGAYVGKSYINTQNLTDTLSFSFGMDKKIIVKRDKAKEFCSTKWIGSTKTQTFAYTINLHNTHTDSLTIEVYDQVPLTTDKDIEIVVLDKGNADLVPETGKLTWKIKLAPGEARKLTFSYSVKYPKNKPLQNLW
jgi:uncharacterized protein (TIGR02231 family)